MTDRTILLTGATSGIGRAAALALATPGHRLLVAGRDATLLERLAIDLRATGAGEVVPLRADLGTLAGVRSLASQVRAVTQRLDVLANNAGAIFDTRVVTADGFERTFALNHVSYFVLTRELLDLVAASPDGRIVNTASDAHRRARLDLADLQSERRYVAWLTYGMTKLCNVLFTRALARRLAADPAARHVSTSAFHPGFIASRFGDDAAPLFRLGMRLIKAAFAKTEAQGADTLVWLATAPGTESRSGGYFYQRRPGTLSTLARDDDLGERLWAATDALVQTGY